MLKATVLALMLAGSFYAGTRFTVVPREEAPALAKPKAAVTGRAKARSVPAAVGTAPERHDI